MKKIVLIFLIIASLVLICGCSSDEEADTGDYPSYPDSSEYSTSYPSSDYGYEDDSYDGSEYSGYDSSDYVDQYYENQIQQMEREEEIREYQDKIWKMQTDRLVEDMDY